MSFLPLSIRSCVLRITIFVTLTLVGRGAPFVLTPVKPSGIYDLGEKAGWNVTVTPGASTASGPYTYTLKKNAADVILSGTLDPQSPSAITTTLSEPGMLFLEITAAGDKKDSQLAGAAVAPTKLAPVAPAVPWLEITR